MNSLFLIEVSADYRLNFLLCCCLIILFSFELLSKTKQVFIHQLFVYFSFEFHRFVCSNCFSLYCSNICPEPVVFFPPIDCWLTIVVATGEDLMPFFPSNQMVISIFVSVNFLIVLL